MKESLISRIHLIILLVILTGVSAFAQEPWEGEIESKEVVITNVREITLPKANRLFEKIPPRPAEPIKPEITYQFKAFNFNTPEINPVIRPLKLKQQSNEDAYRGYVSLGYGNYGSPYAEAFINNKPNKNNLIGAHALLNSSSKGPVDDKNSGGGMSEISVFAQTYSKTISLNANVGYQNKFTHFYGYPEGMTVIRDTLRQSFNIFDIGLGVSNAKNSAFSYYVGGDFSYLDDKFNATESKVDFDFKSAYKFSEKNAANIKANYILLSRKDKGIDAKPRSLFQAGAAYAFTPSNEVKFQVGAIAALENDTLGSKNFHVFPDVELTYTLSPSVDFVGSLTGGIEAVSLHSLVDENLWLAPAVHLNHTNKLYDLHAGIRARLGTKVLAAAGLSFANLKNYYYFVNDSIDQAKFLTIYDEGSTKRTNLYGSLTFAHADYLNITVRGDLFTYGTDLLKEAYHRPGYRFTTSINYNLYKKLILNFDVIAQGNAKALADYETLESVKLDAAFDLSFKSEYLVSDKFSVFVELNNIVSNKYPLFLNYPARGFQAMGGVTWRF